MSKQIELQKVNKVYEQVSLFVRKHPRVSATGGTGLISLLADLCLFNHNIGGLIVGGGITYGVLMYGQHGKSQGTAQVPVVDVAPPMGRIDEQRSERTFGERLKRLFDQNANGPNQPIRGIVKEEPQDAQETVSDRQEAVLPVQAPVRDVRTAREQSVAQGRFPEPQDMAEIIEHGFKPSRESILLMNTINGYATEKISKLHHIGLGGSSGRGKTNTTRLITAQLLACGAKVYMVNPNFAPIKHNGNRLEDWRPIAAKLQEPVARNADDIERLLNHFMKIFEERREREQLTPKRGADLFLVLGEWPVIVEEYPNAVKIIGRLLRQSRQYGIHVIAEFQDALISTIGGSGGTRANYGTAYFFGGDVTTAKTLLSLPDGVKIDNTGLGDMGAVYLKSFSSQAVPGRVPFFSNKALYMLLGCIGEPVTDEPVDEDEFYEDEEDDFEDEDDEGLSEQEQLYEDALKAWGRGVRSAKGMQEALRLDFDEAQELLREMDELGLIAWKEERPNSVQAKVLPIIPEKGRRAEEIDINAAIAVYNAGNTSRYQLAKVFDLSENQGRKLKEIIELMAGE